MDKTLYDLMDWAAIEELVYSEAANPDKLLGPHVTDQGLLIQTFIPTAAAVTVKSGGKKYPMEMQDEAGFYAVLLPRKSMTEYTLEVTYDTGMMEEIQDPYAFATLYEESELKQFEAGIDYEVYRKMGAHPMKLNGVEGVYFSVWAPCAMRVSVVGDFNLWDGRRHQMRKLGDSGIYDLFVPGLETGTIYKYEIKNQHGEPMLKSDPYGNFSELRPNTASVVWNLADFQWKDAAWMAEREKTDSKEKPMSIYELHLGSWMRKQLEIDDQGAEVIGSEFYNYREIAPKLAAYVKDLGYTHIELMPVMEHPLDASWGYQVTGYYAPTSRYGTPDDFMYFMNYMHEQGVGVILDWVPAHFPRDAYGLACFDGTCVYEHKDPRQGAHPHWGTLIYNYGRPQVSNFLIANALFWAKEYHADGIRMDAVASMLYLDYGKNDGEWVANIYGGHENLEAVEFLKHLNSVFKKQAKGAVLIAEESTAWPQITGDVKEDGLGFDYKWNMGWMNDFTGYMQYDPYFRSHHYGELTFSMLYTYSENFILVFSHDEVVHGKSSMLCKMPGESYEAKANNLRVAYGFMYAHPGKKLLFMGQEFGQISEWNENEELPWEILKYPLHKTTQDYVKALNKLYQTQPALYEKDFHPDGFEWINCTSGNDNIVVFLRKTDKPEETLLFVCNFAPIEHKDYKVGVPFYGKYKEIFNSDDAAYGGSGKCSTRTKNSKQEECDERENCLYLDVPPMAMVAFSCTPMPVPVKKVAEKKPVEKKAPVKKAAAKKPVAAKKVAEKKAEAVKPVAKKTEAVKPVEKKTEAVKSVEKKTEAAKLVEKKTEAVKPVEKKAEAVKPVEKKAEAVKPVAKKAEAVKPVEKKTEAVKPAEKKAEPVKPTEKKPAAAKTTARKTTKPGKN